MFVLRVTVAEALEPENQDLVAAWEAFSVGQHSFGNWPACLQSHKPRTLHWNNWLGLGSGQSRRNDAGGFKLGPREGGWGEEEDAADVARPEPILQERHPALRGHLRSNLCQRWWRRNDKGFLLPALPCPGHEGAGHRLRDRGIGLLHGAQVTPFSLFSTYFPGMGWTCTGWTWRPT